MSALKIVPAAHVANRVRIADFVELECLRRADGSVSTVDVSRIMGRQDDSDDDDIQTVILDAFSDLADRASHCGEIDGEYPFEISNDGNLLSIRDWKSVDDRTHSLVYFFLLLATRLNMKTSRMQGGEDGTALFEQLCREVAVRFWGGPGKLVEAIVFGTGRDTEESLSDDDLEVGQFGRAVNELCKAIGEGEQFQAKTADRVTAKDGKLDIVVWRGFSDRRHGQLIGFGQCKTGTNWNRELGKLKPDSFCRKWMRTPPASQPVVLYFVCDRVLDGWYNHVSDGGILFDRCRVMEYATQIPMPLLKRIEKWVSAATQSEGLTIP